MWFSDFIKWQAGKTPAEISAAAREPCRCSSEEGPACAPCRVRTMQEARANLQPWSD